MNPSPQHSNSVEQTDHLALARAYGNVGVAYQKLKKLRRALTYYRKSLQNARLAGDLHSEACALKNTARALAELEEFPRAVRKLEELANIQLKTGDHRNLASTYGEVGRIFLALGHLDDARENFAKQIELSQTCGDSEAVVRVTELLKKFPEYEALVKARQANGEGCTNDDDDEDEDEGGEEDGDEDDYFNNDNDNTGNGNNAHEEEEQPRRRSPKSRR